VFHSSLRELINVEVLTLEGFEKETGLLIPRAYIYIALFVPAGLFRIFVADPCAVCIKILSFPGYEGEFLVAQPFFRIDIRKYG